MVLVLYPAYPRLLQTLPGLDSSFKGSIGAAQRTPDGGLHAELRRTEYTTTYLRTLPPFHRPAGPPCRPCPSLDCRVQPWNAMDRCAIPSS